MICGRLPRFAAGGGPPRKRHFWRPSGKDNRRGRGNRESHTPDDPNGVGAFFHGEFKIFGNIGAGSLGLPVAFPISLGG